MSDFERKVPLYNFGKLAEDLKGSTITYTGETITIMTRSRDRLSHELKKALSHAVRQPINFTFQSTQGYKKEWWLHGTCHNPFGGPCVHTVTDTDYLEHYYDKHGQAIRDGGPAKLEHQYGKRYQEEWISPHGHHRVGGPALIEIEYDPESIGCFKERTLAWCKNGNYYNEDSWTHQIDKAGYEKFEIVPRDGLMRTLRVETRTIRWFDENKLKHRANGPAMIVFHDYVEIQKKGNDPVRTWNDWSGYWYIHGVEIPYGKILTWAKKHRFLMWNEPCYDRSAFRTSDGEFCFLTDFAGAKI